MKIDEMRRNLTEMKLCLDDMERKILQLVDGIYELEDKICDIELRESLNFRRIV